MIMQKSQTHPHQTKLHGLTCYLYTFEGCVSVLSKQTDFKHTYNYEKRTIIRGLVQNIHSMQNFPNFKVATKS